MTARTAIVLFTRDLRVHDHPALATTCAAFDRVVPLYVLDPELAGRSANRTRFLHQALAELAAELRERGGDLVVRRGDPVAETIRLAGQVGATAVALSADVSRYAHRRERRLRAECERHRLHLRLFPGLTVVEPGTLRPGGGGDHYRVFSPYHRVWAASRWRDELAAPERIALPDGVRTGRLPAPPAGESPDAAVGGERLARQRLTDWLPDLGRYDDQHDDMAGDGTSRLSPYLRFGCVSPRGGQSGRRPVRAVRPAGLLAGLLLPGHRRLPGDLDRCLPVGCHRAMALRRRRADGLGRGAHRNADRGRRNAPDAGAGLAAQPGPVDHRRLPDQAPRAGLAGRGGGLLPLVAGRRRGEQLRQLAVGRRHRQRHQAVPGFNPVRQAERYDPDGDYVRRWVPELAAVPGKAVHQPWRLPDQLRRTLDYPPPLTVPGTDPVWLR
ncbi:deoxyribodipyrimidine photo-lyase [Micromonospora vulcania]